MQYDASLILLLAIGRHLLPINWGLRTFLLALCACCLNRGRLHSCVALQSICPKLATNVPGWIDHPNGTVDY